MTATPTAPEGPGLPPSHDLAFDASTLPQRAGLPPRVYPGPPQHQLDQLPSQAQWLALRADMQAWRTATQAPSRRAEPGTLGLYVPENEPRARSLQCFLLGSEFAHHHPESDGGLHLVLPADWHAAAIRKGWAMRHTLAGQPTVSSLTVLVFAPRDDAERRVVLTLVAVAERFARGLLR